MKPENIEKAKKIFKSVLGYSNQFYQKHKKELLDKEFEKLLDGAKHAAQTAAQIWGDICILMSIFKNKFMNRMNEH